MGQRYEAPGRPTQPRCQRKHRQAEAADANEVLEADVVLRVGLFEDRPDEQLVRDGGQHHEGRRHQVDDAQGILCAAVPGVEEAQLAAEAVSLIPTKQVEDHADLLGDVLQQALGQDHEVESVALSDSQGP
eukprot:UN2626